MPGDFQAYIRCFKPMLPAQHPLYIVYKIELQSTSPEHNIQEYWGETV